VAYSLEAPPALCAILGAVGSFDFNRPDFSGINAGANVGRSVLHSARSAPYSPARNSASRTPVSVQWGENVHYDTPARSRSRSSRN